MYLKECEDDGERTTRHDLWGVAEATRFVQLRDEETEVSPNCCLWFPKAEGCRMRYMVSSDKMWGDGLKLCHQKSRLDIGENIIHWECILALEQCL